MGSLKVIALLCFISSCASVKHRAQEPFVESYDLSDPRNPDCGCHSWQKLADKEFQKLQQQELAVKHEIVKSRSFGRHGKFSFNKAKGAKRKRAHPKLGKAVDCFKWH